MKVQRIDNGGTCFEENISRKQNEILQLCRILNACAEFLWLCRILMEAANQVAAYIL